MLFGGAKIVFFHPRLRSNQGGLRYFTGHVGMPAELRDNADQGYGRGVTPIFTGVFEPLARVALYLTDEDGLGTWFAAA